MTITVTLNPIGNLQDTTTAQTQLNNNNTAVSGGFTTALNVTGDQMKGNLDMNSNQILNLPAPATANSPVRLTDVTGSSQIASVPPVGTSGAVVGLLNANNTFSGTQTFSSITTDSIAIVSNITAFQYYTFPTYTVTGLPSPLLGAIKAYVTDATATSFNSIVTGGGVNIIPVHSDGVNWRIG
jgi:hypothetical protein